MTLEEKYPKASLKLLGATVRIIYGSHTKYGDKHMSSDEYLVQYIKLGRSLILKTPTGRRIEIPCHNHSPKNVKFEVVKYRATGTTEAEDLLVLLDILEERYTEGKQLWK